MAPFGAGKLCNPSVGVSAICILGRDTDEVVDTLEHSSDRRIVQYDHFILVMFQP